MKKTLQECKEIVAKEHLFIYKDILSPYLKELFTDLANKMYYEQSENENLKAENQNLINEIHQLRLRINNIYDNC